MCAGPDRTVRRGPRVFGWVLGRYRPKVVDSSRIFEPPDMPTIAHAFKEHGFDTAYFGKWHLDGFHERDGRAAMHIVPPERRGGFDNWVGYENNNSTKIRTNR